MGRGFSHYPYHRSNVISRTHTHADYSSILVSATATFSQNLIKQILSKTDFVQFFSKPYWLKLRQEEAVKKSPSKRNCPLIGQDLEKEQLSTS